MSRPVCGKCLYDLTGSEGIRCPECGSLFIEAGIHRVNGTNPKFKLQSRHVLIAVLLISILAGGLSIRSLVHLIAARSDAVATKQDTREAASVLIDKFQETLDSMELPENTKARLSAEVETLYANRRLSESEYQQLSALIEKHVRRH